MEAFHWRYHPLAQRIVEILRSGELGPVTRIRTALCFPLVSAGDTRWQADLAGGALMDAGCYAVHMARTFAGSEPEVLSATARLGVPARASALVRRLRVPGYVTYRYQLGAFRDAVVGRRSPLTDAQDAVANMRVIDAVYRAAGMEPRLPTAG